MFIAFGGPIETKEPVFTVDAGIDDVVAFAAEAL